MKKGFTSFSLLPFTKKLGRSSYDATMTHYDVILILSEANYPKLWRNNFFVLTINRRGVI